MSCFLILVVGLKFKFVVNQIGNYEAIVVIFFPTLNFKIFENKIWVKFRSTRVTRKNSTMGMSGLDLLRVRYGFATGRVKFGLTLTQSYPNLLPCLKGMISIQNSIN